MAFAPHAVMKIMPVPKTCYFFRRTYHTRRRRTPSNEDPDNLTDLGADHPTSVASACHEIRFGETCVNCENFEAMQGFHAGWRKSGIGGADGKHGLHEYTQTHVVYLQRS